MTTATLAPTEILPSGTQVILKRGGLRGVVTGLIEEPDLWGGPAVHGVKLTHRYSFTSRAWERLPSPQFSRIDADKAERIQG